MDMGDTAMDFKQLETFVAAVDEGSFSNAAERLQLSQSMVTIHIRNLEAELGTRLLNRTTRSMELSQDGRTFYGYAKQMLKLNRDSIFALSRANRDERCVNIVTTPYISRYYVANRLVGFHRLHPEAAFNVITTSSSDIHNRLQSEEAEFAFCTMKPMNAAYAVKHCESASLVVITPDEERFRAINGTFPKALFGDEPLITRSGASTLQQEFLRWSKLNIPDVKLKIAAAVDDTETIKQLVAEGVGIAVISEAAVRQERAEGSLLAFALEDAMPYHLYFAHRKKYLSPEQAAFRDFVLESGKTTDVHQ